MWQIDKTAELLFDYLRNVIYDPKHATLDLDALDPKFLDVGKGLMYFVENVQQMRDYAKALSKGDLNAAQPAKENEMAAPLKALHASLRHMSWQTQQVAKGDYQQRLEFMGDFAEAFNTMIIQLDERQKALERQIEKSRQQTLALEQSNSLFEAITEKISQWIIVVDRTSGERLFANRAAEEALQRGEEVSTLLNDWLSRHRLEMSDADRERTSEAEIVDENGDARYYSVTSYPLQWRQRSALAYVLSDVSSEREHMQQLENYAYMDNLTRVHNRYYGMQQLRGWVEEERQFCLCFIDLDNLKYVNDTYGHSEGDNYIIAVADLLRGLSQEAVVCRLGGDEFMLLIENVDGEEAKKRMEEIRHALRLMTGQGGLQYERSISYGIVEVAEDNTATSSELLALADERMYIYKRAHRRQRQSIQD